MWGKYAFFWGGRGEATGAVGDEKNAGKLETTGAMRQKDPVNTGNGCWKTGSGRTVFLGVLNRREAWFKVWRIINWMKGLEEGKRNEKIGVVKNEGPLFAPFSM